MGKIIIQEETTKNPITLIGKEAGVCWCADSTDDEKNYRRGLECLEAGHGRTWEYPDVYLIIDGYSARVLRELYTHIGGLPTRLQASTRYIDYKNFGFVEPPSISGDIMRHVTFTSAVDSIRKAMLELEQLGAPKEDIANLLPLGMKSRMVAKYNLRTLIDMSHQRECTRAYWEFRDLFADLKEALSGYSEEWKYLVDNYFMPKCEWMGKCTETHGCGRIG